jgi:hypothetical protein
MPLSRVRTLPVPLAYALCASTFLVVVDSRENTEQGARRAEEGTRHAEHGSQLEGQCFYYYTLRTNSLWVDEHGTRGSLGRHETGEIYTKYVVYLSCSRLEQYRRPPSTTQHSLAPLKRERVESPTPSSTREI